MACSTAVGVGLSPAAERIGSCDAAPAGFRFERVAAAWSCAAAAAASGCTALAPGASSLEAVPCAVGGISADVDAVAEGGEPQSCEMWGFVTSPASYLGRTAGRSMSTSTAAP
eukprot:scaffold1421_cov255-Pinguiococcus_pyrenoidosus.AAC.17